MTPKKGGGKGSGGKGAGKKKPGDTSDFELGDDFLADLDPDQETGEQDAVDGEDRVFAEPETEDHQLVAEEALDEELTGEEELVEGGAADEDDADEGDADDDEDEIDEDDLEALINAETQEWTAEDAAEAGLEGHPDSKEHEAATSVAPLAAAGAGAGFAAAAYDEDIPDNPVLRVLTAPVRFLRRHVMPLWARFLLASFLIIASTATATSASVLLFFSDIATELQHDGAFNKIENKLDKVAAGDPQTIMIVGSDLRPELVKKGLATSGLSDTTMLLRLDPDRNAIALFSLPRDLKVSIPGYGTNKLNAAYSFGGPELTLQTVRNLTKNPAVPELKDGLQVNHIVNIDFEGFARAVNAIDCVYIDVDRRYYNKNVIGDGLDDYDEIDIQPGYQALCGFDALDYARYRHTDNDVVRATRQQDFLREARQKVPPSRIFITDRSELLDIFTKYTTSDIDGGELIDLLKLFVAARDAEVKEVHFEGELGPSYVTASQSDINKAVNQFLGITDTPGQRGGTAEPRDPADRTDATKQATGISATGNAAAKAKARAKKKAAKRKISDDAQLSATTYGRQLAKKIRNARFGLPVLYPTVLETGSDYAEKPRVYKINGTGDGSPPTGERAAYKWVFSRPALGEYYGFMATKWKNPPILENPSEERHIKGRDYKFYYDGDRLRTIAWQDNRGSYWLSNTLIQSLSDREMLEIAKGFTKLKKG